MALPACHALGGLSLLRTVAILRADAAPLDRVAGSPHVREHPAGPGMVVVRDVPIRTAAVYSGTFRPLSADSRRLLTKWADAMGVDVARLRMFQQELRVDDAGVAHWLPVQDTLVPTMTSELKVGDAMELFLVYVGHVDGRYLLLVNAFSHEGPTPPAGRAPVR